MLYEQQLESDPTIIQNYNIEGELEESSESELRENNTKWMDVVNNTYSISYGIHWNIPIIESSYESVCSFVANKFNIDISTLHICCNGKGITHNTNA